MKKLSILLAAVILAMTALIAGCGSSSVADEFVGTWVSQSGRLYLSVEKQGNHTFIMYLKIMLNPMNLIKEN